MSGNRKARIAHVNGLKEEIERLKRTVAHHEANERKHQAELRKARSERSARLDATLNELIEVTYRRDKRIGYSLQVAFPDQMRLFRDSFSTGTEYLADVICDRVKRDIVTMRFQAIAIEAEREQQERMRQRYSHFLGEQAAE